MQTWLHQKTDHEPVPTIRKILNLQSKITPQQVGRPLSIVEVSQNGPVWIERGNCADKSQKH